MSSKEKTEIKTDNNSIPFIHEKIVCKKKKRIRKIIVLVFLTAVLATIFGFVCRLTFELSGPLVCKILGDDIPQKEITFPTTSPDTSLSQDNEVIQDGLSVDGKDTNNTGNHEQGDNDQGTNGDKGNSSQEEVDDKGKEPEQIIIREELDAGIKDYISMYDQISNIVENVNTSIVTVSGVKKGVDWFDNPYETMNVTSGLVIANNEEQLIILTNKDKIIDANNIKVTFMSNITVSAELKASDSDSGLAVVTVALKDLPDAIITSTSVAVLGESYTFSIGDPIIALGNPNGHMYSMNVGIITNKIHSIYITDNKLELFNTNIENNTNSEGVITNLKGEVIGIITQKHKKDVDKNLNTVLAISKIKPIIEKLVNGKNRIYFGIVAADLTAESAAELDIYSGIYITEVETNSPAFDAGMQSGDILVKIDDAVIPTVSVFNNIVSSYKVKDSIKVYIKRISNGVTKEKTLTITLEKKTN